MSQPAPSASPPAPLPEPTAGQAVKLLVSALSRLIHPSIAADAIRAAASEAGLSGHVDAYLAEVQSVVPAPNKRGRRGKEGSEKKEKKERAGRAPHPFTIFVAKCMERIKDDPVYHQRSMGPDGKPARGSGMTMSGLIWKGLSEETREAFSRAYQPLCDELKSERDAGSTKPDLKARISAFEQSFPAATKELMKKVLPDKLPPALAHAAAEGAAGALHGVDADVSSEESSEEGSSDEEDEEEEARRKEEERKAQEEAARKAKEEEERKKKEKKESKKKTAAGAPVGTPTPAAAAAAPSSEGKKKHKAKDQAADANGTAKKAKKAAA